MRKIRIRIRKKLRHIYENIFIGKHSTTIVVGFMTGATIFARSIWQFLYQNLGLAWTMFIGFFIFFISGLYMDQFYNEKENRE